jgi:DnaJ-class molecular chaperone
MPAPDSCDVQVTLTISEESARSGITVEIESPAQTIKVAVPAGIAHGQKMRVARHGHLRPDGTRGDFYIAVHILESR